MTAIEIRSGRDPMRRVTLDGALVTITIGSDPESVEIVVRDTTVSGLHAAFDRIGRKWTVRDLGSRNGTQLNGKWLTVQTQLHDQDEIDMGRTRVVFRLEDLQRPRTTDAVAGPPPNITKTEKQVLVHLCRPLLAHNAFQPPASVREIAQRMYIGKNAVQAHLVNLYGKFGIPPYGTDRRIALANEAVRRGAVGMRDLDDDKDPPEDGPPEDDLPDDDLPEDDPPEDDPPDDHLPEDDPPNVEGGLRD